MERQSLFQGELLKRVVGPTFAVGGAEHPDNLLAPFHEPLEDRPPKRLLSVDDNAHSTPPF
jgi:hypothetical protein